MSEPKIDGGAARSARRNVHFSPSGVGVCNARATDTSFPKNVVEIGDTGVEGRVEITVTDSRS